MAEIQVETNVLIVQFKCNATDELNLVHSMSCRDCFMTMR